MAKSNKNIDIFINTIDSIIQQSLDPKEVQDFKRAKKHLQNMKSGGNVDFSSNIILSEIRKALFNH